jgi:hypothetical protein
MHDERDNGTLKKKRRCLSLSGSTGVILSKELGLPFSHWMNMARPLSPNSRPPFLSLLARAWNSISIKPSALPLPPHHIHLPKAQPLACSRRFYSAASVQKPTSGRFANLLGTLRTMSMIDYPSSGRVKAEDILFPMDHA